MRYLLLLPFLILSTLTKAQVLHETLQSSLKELEFLGEVQIECGPNTKKRALEVPVEHRHRYVDLNIRSKDKARYKDLELSVLTPEQAQAIHKKISQLDYIPKKYLEDGCYARGHEVALIAKQNNLSFGKAFLVSKDRLLFPNEGEHDFHKSFQGWRYHTAAMALVREENGELSAVVFDIGVSQKAQRVAEWKESLASKDGQVKFVVREQKRIYHDSSITAPDRSILKNLKRTQDTIDELGYDEYIFRLEQGWL